jgi:CheY-like chemotaxis protein
MRKEAILVVEDEAIMRDSLVDWFSSAGHTVDAADDGDEALEAYKLEDYDAMIIDLKLPGRDGLDVLAEVRRRNPKARVVIVTAYPSYETAVEAMRRGATDYLPKPFELERLESSLRWTEEISVPPVIVPPVEVPTPPVEEPLLEEENVTPCIWEQGGLAAKRMCTSGYQCNAGCEFHVSMMKRDKCRNDPRMKPFLDRLSQVTATHQCRYVLSGDVSSRSCSSLYSCEGCEFAQRLEDEVERQLEVRAENKRRKKRRSRSAREDAGKEPGKWVH